MQEDTMWGNVFRKQELGTPGILAVLSNIPVFKDLSRKELKAIERILHKRTYKKDEALFNEGDPGVGMYIIEHGRINITIGSENKMVASLSNGEFFGEMALLSETPRTATAVAAVPTNILGFFQSDLFGLTETNPKMGNKILFKIAQMIAERLRFSNLENQQLREKLNATENKPKGKKSE
jgi:CRP/FNR family transcriptional regulator, cyclic AMP receptor protein